MNAFKKAPTLTSISRYILHTGFILLTYSMAIPFAAGQSVIGSASNKELINNQLHEWSVGKMCAVSTTTTPVLVKAMQEQQVFIKQLHAQNTLATKRI
jgi:hypothetical protein